MTYEDDDREPEAWAKGSMNFNVQITNAQEDFFVREISAALIERVSRDMLKRIEKTANDLIEQRLRTRMEAIINDVIEKGLTAPLQPSDAFSNPKGEKITAAEFIAKGAEEYLKTNVDHSGAAVQPGGFGSPKQTRMAWMLSQVVNRQFEKEIGEGSKKVMTEIRNQMKDAAAAWMAKFQAEVVTGAEKAKALASRM